MVRMQRIENWLRSVLSDCRFALRQFHKSPAFAIAAVLILAIGIGANTAIFSLIDAALLRSLPVRDPQQLVVFQWTALHSPNTKGTYSYMSCPLNTGAGEASTSAATDTSAEHGCSFSYPMFHQFQSLQDAFSGVAALGEMVSGDFFDTLGVGSSLGRTLVPSDDTPGAPPVAVLAYGYWQRAFGG